MAARVYFEKHRERADAARGGAARRHSGEPDGVRPGRQPDARAGHGATRCSRSCSGRSLITKAQLDAAQQAPLPSPEEVKLPGTRGPAQYFAEYVKQQLIPYYGSGKVFGGGLKVYTTIDLDLQQLAREAIDKWLTRPERAGRPRSSPSTRATAGCSR